MMDGVVREKARAMRGGGLRCCIDFSGVFWRLHTQREGAVLTADIGGGFVFFCYLTFGHS